MSIKKNYLPKDIEQKWYDFWIENKVFEPKESEKIFSVAIPPPNITGMLHMGHVLNNSIQDTIVRFKRMKGFSTLWIPGTDHAGISTQQKVEEKLAKEGKTLQDVGRDGFLKETWDWKEKHGNLICEQFRRLGLSLDWSREKFTMEPALQEAVKECFARLYKDGLIYKGEYIVNWSPGHKTALSDDEVDYKEVERKIWKVAYPLVDGGEIVLATTRPETIPADTAIAIHPEDPRTKDLLGKKVKVPFTDREVIIIADEAIDKDFGEGMLKVTPGHAVEDFEIGKRHNLQIINMFNKDLTIAEGFSFAGMTIMEARKASLKELKSQGLLRGEEKIVSNIGHCSKSGTMIEPIISTQWFVKMEPLAKRAIEVVKNKQVKIRPAHWEKTYFHWMENIRDWCISRQIWWGHRIPVSYSANGEIHLDENGTPEGFMQEQDVLDTWFSSWLWPFSVLGWPNDTADLKKFYPTSMVVTGADIIFFWVARMVMASLYFLDDIPFENVYFHGIVRDEQGRKMSKSLGNSPDPLATIEKYGADSLRFAMLYNNTMGQDLSYSEQWVEMGQGFCNKLWNTFRFIDMNLEGEISEPTKLDLVDKWILGRLNKTIQDVNKYIDSADLELALKSIYNFFWKDFCDWYIELAKVDLKENKDKINVLFYTFKNILKLLHPFIPFVTEEIWSLLVKDGILAEAKFPEALEYKEHNIEELIEVVRSIRNVRKEIKIGNKQPVDVHIKLLKGSLESSWHKYIYKLGNVKNLTVSDVSYGDKGYIKVGEYTEVSVIVDKLVSSEAEQEKILSQIDREQKELDRVSAKLSDERFVSKAPQHILDREKRIQKESEEKIASLKNRLSND